MDRDSRQRAYYYRVAPLGLVEIPLAEGADYVGDCVFLYLFVLRFVAETAIIAPLPTIPYSRFQPFCLNLIRRKKCCAIS